MSSDLSPRLPFLPIEVKKEILKFCDQPTLAKTSGLSLTFLQLSSPLLYRHIVFEGPEGLTKFLTLVAKKRHPELEPWLNLSLVHSVTYVDVKDYPFNSWGADEPGINPRRLLLPSSPTPGHLALHSFKVALSGGMSRTRLEDFFNPIRLRLEGAPRGDFSLLSVNISLWTRLRQLVFVDACFPDHLLLADECGVMHSSNVDGLQIAIHLTPGRIENVVDWLLDEHLDVRGDESGLGAQRLSRIEVVVHGLDKEQRIQLLEGLTESLPFSRFTVVDSSTDFCGPAFPPPMKA
ncbi:hypothetical protein BDY24DRAFT_413206 [Mrakia frigida]|uniref:uncharacterized protein n=1 Tax=Mrakia frigida TaxID=29902 RepID=UPI003FCC13FD